MAFSTITIGLQTSLNTTGNTSAISLTYTLTSSDYADLAAFTQNVWRNGGMFTDSKHWIPVQAIQWLDLS